MLLDDRMTDQGRQVAGEGPGIGIAFGDGSRWARGCAPVRPTASAGSPPPISLAGTFSTAFRDDELLVVWIVTLVGGGLTVAFGALLGVPSLGLHLVMSAALAISGALVLILIIALSNPFRGDFRVSTQPFDQVLAQIQVSTTPH